MSVGIRVTGVAPLVCVSLSTCPSVKYERATGVNSCPNDGVWATGGISCPRVVRVIGRTSCPNRTTGVAPLRGVCSITSSHLTGRYLVLTTSTSQGVCIFNCPIWKWPPLEWGIFSGQIMKCSGHLGSQCVGDLSSVLPNRGVVPRVDYDVALVE